MRLAAERDVLGFEVADDGAGFDVPAGTSGAGVQNMADRIGALGGELRIDSAPGKGTTASGHVPLVRSLAADDPDAPPGEGL